MRKHRILKRSVFIGLSAILLSACYTQKWNKVTKFRDEIQPAPPKIEKLFADKNHRTIYLKGQSPAYDYKYDVGEKDSYYGKDEKSFRFTTVAVRLHKYMPLGKVVADLTFIDQKKNKVSIKAVDLLRFVPTYDSPGDMIYPEILEEEFNRFGYTFRKEHKEFNVELAENANSREIDAQKRAYRCQVVNNCLAATKWEFSLITEDYSDFKERLKNKENLNQNKILSHTWFYMDDELYYQLLAYKNERFTREMSTIKYDALSSKSENVFIDFKSLRHPIKYRAKTTVEEFGYQTARKIEPLDNEQFYKKNFNLVLSDTTKNYQTILEDEIQTTQFKDEGFYNETTPKKFSLSWMKYLDSVYVDVVNVNGTEAYVQITLTGQYSPYNITLGNVDLALVDEQKLLGFLYGFNTYPKSRRYNPKQSTIAYDPDLLPREREPYLLLTDKKTGKWVNNQYKGIEKIFLTYESLERENLMIYVLSYERIIPVWMSKVKLPNDLREKVRIRKGMYNY